MPTSEQSWLEVLKVVGPTAAVAIASLWLGLQGTKAFLRFASNTLKEAHEQHAAAIREQAEATHEQARMTRELTVAVHGLHRLVGELARVRGSREAGGRGP